jgi:ABC-type nitrate/sulfonate/bicarbonate transport system ATPase subunit
MGNQPVSEAKATNTSVSIKLSGIVQDYPAPSGDTVRTIDGVDLTLDRPGFNMLLGPSGCGKTTLLRMMGGVRPFNVATPTAGRVEIDGVLCEDQHDDAVMVFQQYANRPDLSVWHNVAFPFRLDLWRRSVAEKEQKERVDAILAAVGLSEKKNLYPSQLSGGQNQRVALARALVLRPRILLMDEPFGALDAQTREEMQQLLVQLHAENPCLVVFVTHDVSEALVLGDRVIVLSPQPAKITDDFAVTAERPRTGTWMRSTEGMQMQERILSGLRDSRGKGQVRVSV